MNHSRTDASDRSKTKLDIPEKHKKNVQSSARQTRQQKISSSWYTYSRKRPKQNSRKREWGWFTVEVLCKLLKAQLTRLWAEVEFNHVCLVSAATSTLHYRWQTTVEVLSQSQLTGLPCNMSHSRVTSSVSLLISTFNPITQNLNCNPIRDLMFHFYV